MKALWLEELPVGESFTLGQHRFTAEEIEGFAYPKALLSCGGWMACYVSFNAKARAERLAREGREPTVGPSPGIDRLEMLRPVHAGETITYTSRVLSKRAFQSKPGWGIYESANEGVDAQGGVVMRFVAKVLIATRG